MTSYIAEPACLGGIPLWGPKAPISPLRGPKPQWIVNKGNAPFARYQQCNLRLGEWSEELLIIKIIERKRSYLFIACECAFIMVHIPPWSHKLGFKIDYDLWNIMGTAKFYLLLELCKISHPLWLRRYEAAAARLQSRKEPDMIGTFFCATGTLSQFDPLDVFVLTLLIALGMFTMWIYFMERTRIDFNLLDTVDYVLSSFFTVPTADQQVLRTLTGRLIKIFIGLFSMAYGAIIGWTFGFRVAENTQTMTDLLEDVNAYINHRQRQATRIQKW